MVRPLLFLALLAFVSGCSRNAPTPQEPAKAQTCITEWSGPWTAECSAEWVAQIVDQAGYRLTGDTKSAWIAAGRGRSFYVWATDETTPIEQIVRREGYQLVARVAGARIYDDGTRKFWRANTYLFWIQAGPRDDSIAPTPTELAPLIRASRAIPPPS